jgi:hypothetical protein
MPTPSLLIVPARFKSGKLYSQIPNSGAGDFTVTRATSATRVNASGLIESVASGIPRLDYFASGGTVGCPALLVEPSGNNLAFHSTDWTSNWNAGGSNGTTVITNSAISLAPDGTATANEIHPTSGNTNHSRVQNATTLITFVSGTVYTQSAFFKAGVGTTGQFVQLTYSAARFTQNGYANFDLNAGSVLVVSGTTADTNRAARIENYGNGWYRCSFTATCPTNGTGNGVVPVLINASGDSRAPSFAGTVTDYILGWGAQVEIGSIATSYIPTTTAAVTRNADVILVSGAASGSIGQLSGTIYADVDIRNAALGSILTIDDGDTTDFISIIKNANLTIRARIRRAGGTIVNIITSSAVSLGVHKIALGYTNGDYALYIDGSLAGTSTNSTDYPATSLTQCILSNANYGPFNDRIRAAALYTTRLTNAELAALTTP